MADKTNNPPSVRALLAASRQSGPATVYTMAEDGTIASVHTRPARPPWQAGRLTDEQGLAMLFKNGIMPGVLPAEMNCGVQFADNDFHGAASRSDVLALRRLVQAGLMHGFGEGNGVDND